MSKEVKFFNETIFSEGSFKEAKDEKTGKTKYYYESLIVPFGQVSRNKVKYNEKRCREKGETLVDRKLFFNHQTKGNASHDLPRGNWEEVWFKEDGMYARAKVFNTSYNKDFIEYLQADPSPRSSLQVSGSAKQFREEKTNKIYKEAFIDEFLESSVVNIPGFDMAKGGLAATLSEAFDLEGDNMEESITKLSFSDEETTKDAIDILKKNNIKHLPNVRKAVILFNNDEDKKAAKMVLIKQGMNGLDKQSANTEDSLKETHLNVGDKVVYKDGEEAGEVVEVTKLGYVVKGDDDDNMFFVNDEDTLKQGEKTQENFFNKLNKIRESLGVKDFKSKALQKIVKNIDNGKLRPAHMDSVISMVKILFDSNVINKKDYDNFTKYVEENFM